MKNNMQMEHFFYFFFFLELHSYTAEKYAVMMYLFIYCLQVAT